MFRNMNLTVHFTKSAKLNWRWYFSFAHLVSKKNLQMQKSLCISDLVLYKWFFKKYFGSEGRKQQPNNSHMQNLIILCCCLFTWFYYSRWMLWICLLTSRSLWDRKVHWHRLAVAGLFLWSLKEIYGNINEFRSYLAQ